MRTTLLRAGALACALLTTTCLTAPALAQTGQTTPPDMRSVDANGVDLISGDYAFSFTEAAIGSGEGALALTRTGTNGPGANSWQNMWIEQTVAGSVVTAVVVLGDHSETFTRSGSSAFTPELGNGATLTGGPGTAYVYRGPEGTTITFGTPAADPLGNSAFCSHENSDPSGCKALALSLVRPNGARLDFTWDVRSHCVLPDPEAGGRDCDYAWRLSGVSNNFGYQIAFGYVTDGYSFPGGTPDFFVQSGAVLSNAGVSGSTPLTVSYDRSTAGVLAITVPGPTSTGLTWRFTSGSGSFAIRRPGASSDNISVAYGSGGVTSVTGDGVLTNYGRSVSAGLATTTITQVDGDSGTTDPVTTAVADVDKGRLVSLTDPLSHSTTWFYDSSNRVTRAVQPEGNEAAYSYDARGNVTQVRLREKGDTGDTGDDIVTEADYPATCSNVVTCNLPTATRDALTHQTDYTYDSTHGGVLTVTAPAPSSGATRPQTRYAYSQVTAVTGQPVYQLTEISACATGSTASTPTCVGTADETRTVIGYDTVNIRPTSVEIRSGNTSGAGALSATTAFGYNAYGDVTSADGPLSGNADTTVLRYDGARRRIGTVSPDPDGSGSLHHRAVRTTWRDDGQVSKVETGNVDSQSDTDWAGFATLEEAQIEYDGNSRPVVQRLVSGSTAYALTQAGYDGLGRVRCTAQRMNPSEFATASLPSDACAPDTQGSYGPDRIARTSYDAAGRVNRVETGVGVTGLTADEVATTYTDNGRVATVTDALNNRTTYAYDMFDRPYRTYMPSTTQSAGTSSTNDYEELGYDANGNVTSRRLRDGASIGYSYDALGRPIAVDTPPAGSGTGGYGEYDRTYSYDNLSRPTQLNAASTLNVTLAYDALGRQVSETSYFAAKTMDYDLAGRMTRLTWPDGLYIAYDRLVTGEVGAIRENGATSGAGVLATYAYDDRGRRTSLTRGNGTVTGYSYDNADRLTQLVQNLTGTGSDLTLDFGYNPAGQIVSNTRDNIAFSYTGHANLNRTDTINGLNQVTATGSSSVSHDARGNVSAAGADWATYTSENFLNAATSALILPDARLRPVQVYNTATSSAVRFDYLGGQLVAEYNTSNAILRRYVPGPELDEPVAWYEGSGTSTRRWFHADERGSIVAVSDGSGNLVGSAPNRYDEYGAPQGGAITGRFGYTGQAWLPEIGMYDYRNRAYHPGLGRFMQTDPIGYDGGMNLYAYVLDDPVNGIDPSGLAEQKDIWITHKRHQDPSPTPNPYFIMAIREALSGSSAFDESEQEIVLTARRLGRQVVTTTLRLTPPSAPHCLTGGTAQRMEVTGYDNGYRSTGKRPGDRGYGIARDGTRAGPGTLAAPRTFSFGTQMYVPGYGYGVVHDIGGAITAGHLDVWFPTERQALIWGRQHLNVEVCR